MLLCLSPPTSASLLLPVISLPPKDMESHCTMGHHLSQQEQLLPDVSFFLQSSLSLSPSRCPSSLSLSLSPSFSLPRFRSHPCPPFKWLPMSSIAGHPAISPGTHRKHRGKVQLCMISHPNEALTLFCPLFRTMPTRPAKEKLGKLLPMLYLQL